MPNSHHRHKPKHHHQPAKIEHRKRKLSAAVFMTVMFGIFGLSFGYFSSSADPIWSVAGTFAGMAIGYFFGHNMDKAARKKA